MGSVESYSKWNYINGEYSQGIPDANGRSTSTLGLTLQSDKYIFGIYNSSSYELYGQQLYEYLDGGTFAIDPTSQTDIDVCVVNNFYNVCPSIINKIIDKRTGQEISLTRVYLERPTTPCNTYSRRGGSILTDTKIYLPGGNTWEDGLLCRLSVADYKITSDKQTSCCLAKFIDFKKDIFIKHALTDQYLTFANLVTQNAFSNGCPYAFSNGFTTVHCDEFLEPYCASNPNTDICTMFMASKFSQNRSTLSTFVNHCSKNLHDPICLSLSLAAKNSGNTGISDEIIKNYCDNNVGDKSCACYLTSKSLPSNFKDNYYLGPIACWYKPCAELSESQFLPYEYYLQRNKCKITNCTIDINNITDQPNMIEIINYCRAKTRDTVISSTVPGFFDDEIWSPGNLGILTVSLIGLAVLLSTCILPFRKIRNK